MQIGRLSPCKERAAEKPRFLPSQTGYSSRKRADFSKVHIINARKDLNWSCKSPFPTPLIKVSQHLLCIRITLGTLESSDSQASLAEIPVQWLGKPHEVGMRWFSQTKGY